MTKTELIARIVEEFAKCNIPIEPSVMKGMNICALNHQLKILKEAV